MAVRRGDGMKGYQAGDIAGLSEMECGVSSLVLAAEGMERGLSLSFFFFYRSAPLEINKQSVKVLFCENVPNKDSLWVPPIAGQKHKEQQERAAALTERSLLLPD